jgi:hypothetical protein
MIFTVHDRYFGKIKRGDPGKTGRVDAELVGVRAALVMSVCRIRCRNDVRRRQC